MAPPKDYRFSPWEELKTHENLLYSESAIEVREKTTVTIRLKVPSRLYGYAGSSIEVSACAIRHRLAATRPCSTNYNKVVSENTVLCSTVYVVPGSRGQTASTQGVLRVPR